MESTDKKQKTGKIYEGKVVNVIDEKTAKVEVSFSEKHKMYARLNRKVRKFLVQTNMVVSVGDNVRIKEVRKISKRKSFIVLEVIKK